MPNLLSFVIPIAAMLTTLFVLFGLNVISTISALTVKKTFYILFIVLIIFNKFLRKKIESKVTFHKQYDTVVAITPNENGKIWYFIYQVSFFLNQILGGVFLAVAYAALTKIQI